MLSTSDKESLQKPNPFEENKNTNARLYLLSKREWNIFEKNCPSFVKTLIKRIKRSPYAHAANCISVSNSKERYDLHALQSVAQSVPTTK